MEEEFNGSTRRRCAFTAGTKIGKGGAKGKAKEVPDPVRTANLTIA